MNILSFFRHLKVIVPVLCLYLMLTECYSFTGASVPPHLKTLQILTAEDVSGFGDARYREVLTVNLVKNFRSDNSFTLVQESPDATIATTISSIADATVSVNQGELEKERKITLTVKVVWSDLVKKKELFSRDFSAFQIYAISDGVQGRDNAIQKSLQQISNDAVLAVVSGW